ncbi:MAG: alpha/beta hydrolase [Alistipes sp.]|nr:alpha/beta hydrolase [Alistipes sp.]
MKRLLACLVLMLSSSHLMAHEVECHTYHYATVDDQELMLDIYALPSDGSKPRPCMIFAFGGGFVMGERDHEYYARYFDTLASSGIVVASIDYRLGLKNPPKNGNIKTMIGAMQHAIDIAVEDIYSATCFVLQNSEKLNIDPNRVMLSGSSAGAIAALHAEWNRCNGAEIAEVLPKDFSYAAVVACAGAIFSTDGKPKFKSEPAPMLLFHGTSDGNVPYNRSSLFGIGFYGSKYIAKQLDKIDAPYWFYSAKYADHKIAGLPLWYQCNLILQFINDYVLESSRTQIVNNVEYLPKERRQTHFTAKEYLQNNYKHRM